MNQSGIPDPNTPKMDVALVMSSVQYHPLYHAPRSHATPCCGTTKGGVRGTTGCITLRHVVLILLYGAGYQGADPARKAPVPRPHPHPRLLHQP
eukprot:3290809-Rhodomonas_salina.1